MAVLSTEIYSGYVFAQDTAYLFLDIEGAFDNVVPSILINDLVELGLPPHICHFIYRLTSRRELLFVNNGIVSDPYFSYKESPRDLY